jgi:polyhydroxybutyrate depolymerase
MPVKRVVGALLVTLLALLAIALPLNLGALAGGASALASWQRDGALFAHSVASGDLASHPDEPQRGGGKRVVVLSVSQIINHPVVSTGCGRRSPVAPGASGDFSLTSGGLPRSYRVHVPLGYIPTHSYALALSFHGNGSTMSQQERLTHFSALADHLGFLVIYPQGTKGPNGRLGWSSGGPIHPTRNDTLFVSDLLTQAQSRFCIDPARIYATGFSNGGGMTATLACQLDGRIAAFATVSGSYFPLKGGCSPARPAPILEVHGTGDRTVPYLGRAAIDLLATPAWLEQWARRDGCRASPQTRTLATDVVDETWLGCRDGVSLEHLRLTGGAHVWPQGALAPHGHYAPATPNMPQLTQVIWQFVSRYQLNAAPQPAPTGAQS